MTANAYAVGACVGTAAWCSAATLGLHTETGARLAVLPPLWVWPVLVVVAIGVLRLLRLPAPALSVLFGTAVLILPWVPAPVPAVALIWTGVLVPVVWGAVVIGALVVTARAGRAGDLGSWVAPRVAPSLAGGLALVIFLLVAWWLSPRLPGGDEPHYLVITQSLLADGDLRIENNHEQGDYLAYFPGVLRPDFLRRSTDGAIYSIHAPGLPAVIAPAFAVAGYPGVIVFLGAVAALGTALVWWVGYRTTGRVDAAWFGWAVCATTAPFVFLATEVFPDGLGATVLLLGLLPALRTAWAPSGARARPSLWWLSGAALALLPWLHTRFAILAGLAGLLGLSRVRRVQDAVRFLTVPAVSAVAWFAQFSVIYGELNPAAPYAHYTQTSVGNLVRGLPGLLVDQQFGLLANAPVYAGVLLGMVIAAGRGRRWSWEAWLLILPYTLAVGAYQMWWGGASVPARFLTPMTPLVAIAAARVWSEVRTPASRTLLALGLGASALLSLLLIGPERGALLFNFRDGIALWLEWANDVIDLPRGAPSLFRDTPGAAVIKAAWWVGLLALAWAVLRWAGGNGERASRPGRMAALVPWCVAGVLMGGFASGWAADGIDPATSSSAVTDLIRAAGARPGRGVYDYQRGVTQPAEQVVPTLRLGPSDRRPPTGDGVLLGLPYLLPGVHRLHVSSRGPGELSLRIGRNSLPMWRWSLPASGGATTFPLRLPIEARSVYLAADDAAMASEVDVWIQPWADGRRPESTGPGMAVQGAEYAGVSALFLDNEVFVEEPGFWVRAGRTTRVVLGGIEAGRTLVVRNAPVGNLVTVALDGERHELMMDAGQEREFALPAERSGIVLRVGTTTGFRPSEVEPGSTDVRLLGAWVEVR